MSLDDIKKKLEDAFSGAVIEMIDQSEYHEGHMTSSGLHLACSITYEGFEGKSIVQQHQMVYKVLGNELKETFHALALNTKVR